jgi:hypothetical protein
MNLNNDTKLRNHNIDPIYIDPTDYDKSTKPIHYIVNNEFNPTTIVLV